MTLPWAVWTALATGLALQLAPLRWRHAALQCTAALLVWTMLAQTLCTSFLTPADAIDALARGGVCMAFAWSVGFYSGTESPRLWLTVGGLGAVACGSDWLTLGLGWELVRCATTRTTRDDLNRGAYLPQTGLWTGVAAWLFATGSLQLDDVAVVLQQSYAARDPNVSLGRPSLIVVAAACLTVLAVLSPCFTARQRANPTTGARLAQVLAAVMFLARSCDVFVGLEGPVTWILLVTAGLAWGLAVRAVAHPSRLENLWQGCVLWQLALSLNWLVLGLLERTSAAGGWPALPGLGLANAGLLADAVHGIVVLSGVTSAVRLLSRSGRPAEFLEELRGAGRDHPAWSVLLLAPLVSLIGVPPLLGAWLRLLQMTAGWNLPQPAPNDTLMLHCGLLALQCLGLAATVCLAGSLLTVFRTVWWEPAVTVWDKVHSICDWCRALLATGAVAGGAVWGALFLR